MSDTDQRNKLLADIKRLAAIVVFGTLSESYRTCGNPGCRCHTQGKKHGPHGYVSYRGPSGKTTGYYVPKAAHDEVRRGLEAWQSLQALLRELAELNRLQVLERARKAKRSSS